MKVWKVIVAVLVIFAAGAVTGALAMRGQPSAARPIGGLMGGAERRLEYLRRMNQKLDLSPAQHERVENLLKESQERLKKLWEPVAPQFKNEFDSVRKAIMAELTPAQQDKFKQLLESKNHRRPDDGAERSKHSRSSATNPPAESK